MPGGGRRLPRTVRSTVPPAVVPLVSGDMASNKYSPLGSSGLSGLEQPAAPKHFPFPNTPVDNESIFEILMFLYTIVALGLQFLQVYRTVWWLPHSYNNHSMNFYLIDRNLVTFIMIILTRRLVYAVGCKVIERRVCPKEFEHACFVYRIVLLVMMAFSLMWFGYFLVLRGNWYHNIFYLFYPILIYVVFFGPNIIPFFKLVTFNPDGLPPLHACTSNATDIRAEVENLRKNFNLRMKQIIYNSFVNAYYAALLPCCFVPNFLFYDVIWAVQHIAFFWLGCLTAHAIHIIPLRYCDVLHRSALHLGYWDKLEIRSHLPVVHTWQEDTLWPFGALVRHGREIYRGLGEINAAEPGNGTSSRFFTFFWNPSMVLAVLLAVHVAVVLFQLTLLLRSYFYWHNILSVTLLLFFNYYTLFKIGRNYLICQKIYKAEQAMHEKLSDN